MMKAVNYFNADVSNSEYDHIYKFGSNYSTLIGCNYHQTDKNYKLVCSVAEFNQLVTELSNWQPTLPKAETVEYEGSVYELNCLYETPDGIKVVLDSVTDRVGLKVSKLDNQDKWWMEQELFNTAIKLGTITPAPVKLVDGAAYMFEINRDLCAGFYRERRKCFFTKINGGNKICGLAESSKITRLVPEVK